MKPLLAAAAFLFGLGVELPASAGEPDPVGTEFVTQVEAQAGKDWSTIAELRARLKVLTEQLLATQRSLAKAQAELDAAKPKPQPAPTPPAEQGPS